MVNMGEPSVEFYVDEAIRPAISLMRVWGRVRLGYELSLRNPVLRKIKNARL